MPLFFFHIAEAGAEDDEGEEFSNAAAAKMAALESVREILSEGVMLGWDMTGWRMTVKNSAGKIVHDLPFPTVGRISNGGDAKAGGSKPAQARRRAKF